MYMFLNNILRTFFERFQCYLVVLIECFLNVLRTWLYKEPQGYLSKMLCWSTAIPTEERCFLMFPGKFENITLHRTMSKPVGNVMRKYWNSHLRNIWCSERASWVSCTIRIKLWQGQRQKESVGKAFYFYMQARIFNGCKSKDHRPLVSFNFGEAYNLSYYYYRSADQLIIFITAFHGTVSFK